MNGKCTKCGKITNRYISYDLDLPKIWTHKKCEQEVRHAFFAMMSMGDMKMAEMLSEDWYKPIKQ